LLVTTLLATVATLARLLLLLAGLLAAALLATALLATATLLPAALTALLLLTRLRLALVGILVRHTSLLASYPLPSGVNADRHRKVSEFPA
jgi:hypothetical protein